MGIRSLSTASIFTGTKRSKVWDQSAIYSPSAYESIATVTTTGTTSTITFSGIPQTYKHLQLRSVARNVFTVSQGYDWATAAFNGDTTYTNYRSHYTWGNGTTTGTGTLQSSSYQAICANVTRDYYTSGMFAGSITDILDYTDTNKYKTVRMIAGAEINVANTYSEATQTSSVWMNTTAITSITITCPTASFAANTKFALYGIRG